MGPNKVLNLNLFLRRMSGDITAQQMIYMEKVMCLGRQVDRPQRNLILFRMLIFEDLSPLKYVDM